MRAKLTTLVASAIVIASVSPARAQNATGEKKDIWDQPLVAPTNALEIVVGTGYTQGFGALQPGVGMGNVAGPGLGVDLGVGYRIDPHWAVGLVGQYQEFDAQRAASARGLTPGIAASYHIRPYTRLDPWVQLGVGYRFFWENQEATGTNLLTHGLELAKLTIGADFRVDKDVALAPFIGADVGLPLAQSTNNGSSVSITSPEANVYLFAGLQARFDITTRHQGAAEPLPPTTVTSATVKPPEQQMRPVSPSINASEELIERCKLNFGSVDKAPKFEFDKSELLPADYDVLRQIADCVNGPLKGSGLSLVGRADPRGTTEYNDGLGMRRATTVSGFLQEQGVVESRIERSSRGERDAIGTDEASWAIDRRVDVSLAH